MNKVLTLFQRALGTFYCKQSGFKKSEAKTGSVTFIQRFGGSLNLNTHFHTLTLDGIYNFQKPITDSREAHFHEIPAPSKKELEKLLQNIIIRTIRYLEKHGFIQKEEFQESHFTSFSKKAFESLQESSITYRIALGKNKGKKALTLKTIPSTEEKDKSCLVQSSGFSLHAAIVCRPHERNKLERICRYIARPSLSEERLSLNERGQVVYKLKTPYQNGTTHILFEPLDFLSRLSSLVPKPRINLTRFLEFLLLILNIET